jgi:hypothetical protein
MVGAVNITDSSDTCLQRQRDDMSLMKVMLMIRARLMGVDHAYAHVEEAVAMGFGSKRGLFFEQRRQQIEVRVKYLLRVRLQIVLLVVTIVISAVAMAMGRVNGV